VKIVHVYKDYHPPVRGGIEQTLERIARAQAAAGHDVTVVVSASGQRRTYEERIAGVRVVRVAEWARALSSPIAPGFPAAIGRERADLWHLHFPNPLGEVSWLLKSPPGALLVTYYCDVVRQKLLLPVYTPFVHRLLDRADLVQVISPQAMERAESPVSQHREHCRLVPLGIDLESFQSIDRDSPAARALREKYGDPFVLFVGRLRYYKGLDVMLAAMPRISARLVIVGDGPMEEPLRRQAAELGLGDKVVFAGPVSDEELRAHLGAAAIGVLPSTHPSEAFGLAMVEYLAAGVPAVCTELGTGTTFVNADGETGVVVPPGDPVALAAGVERLVADPELRARCGAAGRERASRLFSTPAMMRGLEELYAETIARAARRR
jgi:rhamnosyl/mannosyltransferase